MQTLYIYASYYCKKQKSVKGIIVLVGRAYMSHLYVIDMQ